MIIAVNSVGDIISSYLLKYVGSLSTCFCRSLQLLLVSFIAHFMFGTLISIKFAIGLVLVISANYIFAYLNFNDPHEGELLHWLEISFYESEKMKENESDENSSFDGSFDDISSIDFHPSSSPSGSNSSSTTPSDLNSVLFVSNPIKSKKDRKIPVKKNNPLL